MGNGTTCDTFGTCPGQSTYCDAVNECEAKNMRVCTKDELLSEICCNTGGNCDNHPVWTSTLEPDNSTTTTTTTSTDTTSTDTTSTDTTTSTSTDTVAGCKSDTWPDVKKGGICDDCLALIKIKSYGTCGKYCQSLGLACLSAYEEVSNTCTIESTFGCDAKVLGSDGKVTSDALCKCTADTGSTARDTTVDSTATAKDAGTATTSIVVEGADNTATAKDAGTATTSIVVDTGAKDAATTHATTVETTTAAKGSTMDTTATTTVDAGEKTTAATGTTTTMGGGAKTTAATGTTTTMGGHSSNTTATATEDSGANTTAATGATTTMGGGAKTTTATGATTTMGGHAGGGGIATPGSRSIAEADAETIAVEEGEGGIASRIAKLLEGLLAMDGH